MKRTILLLAIATSALSCTEGFDNGSGAAPVTPAGGDALASPSIACTDAPDAVYGDPGALAPDPAARGNVLKCAKDPELTKEAMQQKLSSLPGFAGKPLTSGARVYRISYRTERGNAASTPSASSALVYVPTVPRAAKLPVVVAARGSRGQAQKCAVTKFDPSLTDINDDAYRLVYNLVGFGYAVILPDLAGYANFGAANNPPSVYANAQDVGRSTLDGGRALKKLFPGLDDKVVLVGHSQGGHSALASLAVSETYGTAGPIAAVATYAPLWVSQRTWGALGYAPAAQMAPIAQSSAAEVSVWYHYTQAALLEPGTELEVFEMSKRAAIEDFVKNECWESTKLEPLGTTADELYTPQFKSQVSFAVATGGGCNSPLCDKWQARYVQDRPRLTGKAATTPILLVYGQQDTTIVASRMKCALDRLAEDQVNLTSCVEPAEGHSTVVSKRGDYVADWIASVTLGATPPPACALTAAAVTGMCATPPPND